MELDETDVKILQNLLSYARLSNRQIARNVRVTVGTVIARIRKMEQEGIIKGYSAILDLERLGYDLTVITEITVSKGKLLDVEQEISKIPNVCAVYDVTGLTDAMVIVKSKNRKELSDFVKTVLAMPFVERTNTHVVLTTVKEDYRGFVNETSHGSN
ncbi:MAG: Lrp/AsnC family transcriptional regulator [Candidatus Hodarchaeota archaeon]